MVKVLHAQLRRVACYAQFLGTNLQYVDFAHLLLSCPVHDHILLMSTIVKFLKNWVLFKTNTVVFFFLAIHYLDVFIFLHWV